MKAFDGSTGVFECSACGNVGLGSAELRCCGGPMDPVELDADTDADAVSRPTLEDLLGTVFEMSDTELELCLCVMAGGELTVSRLAERTGYDRSVVTRHLNHLAELGVLEKRRRLLERGGEVYVYTPTDPAAVERRLERLFLRWVVHASRLLDDLRREKVESIVDRNVEEPQWRIFQRPSE